MANDKFLIAPFDSGLDLSLPVWLTSDDAMQRLNNAYVWRGRYRKRFGSRYMGTNALTTRFRINLGTTGQSPFAPGSFSATPVKGIKWKIGQQFSIGANIYTVWQTTGQMLKTGGTATTYTYDTTNGHLVIVGETDATPVYFYPSEPIMGLDNFEFGAVNNHPSFGFDTQFAYKYTAGAWDISNNSPVFTGSNSDFFWIANWRGTAGADLFFETNFNPNDKMYYWDGATWNDFTTLTVYRTNPTTRWVKTAKMIIPFKGYLHLLNIIETDGTGPNTTNHTNRDRWSWIGDPTVANAWTEQNQVGYVGAGFADAATKEAIIGARFIKDHLIVYFENSTWELVATGNAADPFHWYKLNSELGTEAINSPVIFDKVVLSVAAQGICACNGSNIERVDDKIPQDVFNLRTINNGIIRIAGIRDYEAEVVYWTWPNDSQPTNSSVYPNKILVYNYKNGTWAYNDDCVTAWGVFEQDSADIWAGDDQTWEDDTSTWASGVQLGLPRRIVAGNQQGYTFICEADLTSNAQVMQVTNASYTDPVLTLTIIDHTLAPGDFISLSNMNGFSVINNSTGLPVTIFKIETLPTTNTVTVILKATSTDPKETTYTVTCAYIGGGLAGRVSKIDIVSKRWNPYVKNASSFQLSKMDFCVKATDYGQITVDYSPSSATNSDGNGLSMVDAGIATNSALGSNILQTSPFTLYPLESMQLTLWHPVYFQTQGDSIQIRLYFSDEQMTNPAISQTCDFVLEGILLYTSPTGRLE